MARPQSVSDEQIMQAARRVIAQRGYDGFTLAQVAEELGISRTAIILRFKSTRELKKRITTHTVELLRREMERLPVEQGGDGLVKLAVSIGKHTPSRDEVATLWLVSHGNLQDEELAAHEQERGEILRDAISARMPKTALPHGDAVNAFMAHLSGSVTQWLASGESSPTDFLTRRTQEWLILANIPFMRLRRASSA